MMIATGTLVHHTASLLTESKDFFHGVIESPDKDDDFHTNTIESKYYNIKQTGAFFRKTASKGCSVLSSNIRSLPKNLCLINDILLTVKEMPSIIAMSETKLREIY